MVTNNIQIQKSGNEKEKKLVKRCDNVSNASKQLKLLYNYIARV